MPLYKTLTNRENTNVYIWKITESEAWLRTGLDLSENSINRLFTMSSELHRRGFLSIRHLLRVAGYTDQNLYYTIDGKPHLDDGKNISITHSYEFTAIIVSDAAVGIDIEKLRDKIQRIASKFVGYEEQFVKELDNPIEALTVIWGAKESMYKLYGTKGLGFKAHCFVEPFEIDIQHTMSRIVYEGDNLKFDVYFQSLENFMMAYILPAYNA
ncbi:4-phosphopantetheinyl transferase [Nonlabens arenilitoris]|uniref:4-phosphopantetheinyl transferase n=1 Tax=Nonlabens arenilitoris TaxID=1217969 RepID=A0A2S7UAN6_9FLAO|nr:4'-phosphopantetheinyl transferase superfamily protein [Nonlabens arenilitoris]PQJ31333.1 4-phosphopantetheinyl transferase [Nonlabens arenilitoris]